MSIVVDYMLTAKCNLECPFCYGPNPNMRGELSYLEKIFLIEQLHLRGCTHLIVAGGEPLSSPDAVRFIAAAKEFGLKITLQSNGAFLQRLVEVAPCLDWLALPLDATSVENQLRLRTTTEQLEWTIKAAGAFRERCNAKAQLKIGTVLTPYNLAEIEEMAKIIAQLQPDVWKWYQVRPRGEGLINFESLFLEESKIENTRIHLSQKMPEINIVTSMIEESKSSYLIINPDSEALTPRIDSYHHFGRLVKNNGSNPEFDENVWASLLSALDYPGQQKNMMKTFPSWM